MALIALDFDGVLHDKAHPKPGRVMGAPIELAKESLEALRRSGHTFFLHTAFGKTPREKDVIRNWMLYYGFPMMDIEYKPPAAAYVDDKGVGFTDWRTAYEELRKRGL